MRIDRKFVALAVAVVAACALFVAVLGARISAEGGEPPAKRAMQEAEATRQAVYERGPHAPKEPTPPAASCPTDLEALKRAVGIKPFPQEHQPPRGISPVNYAVVFSSGGVPYTLYAGSSPTAPEQGLLLVCEESLDPCADMAAGRDHPQQFIAIPLRKGAVHVIDIRGDVVDLATSAGAALHFNYVTRAFE